MSRPTPALVPNASDKRMLHVIKTYWRKYPQAVIDTATIASYLMGTDSTAPSPMADPDWEVRYKSHTKTGRTDVARDIVVNLISWSLVESLANAGLLSRIRGEVPPWPLSGTSDEMEELLVLNVDERSEWDLLRLVRFIGKRLPKHHEYDSLIPWVARELVAAWKEAQVPPLTYLRFGDATYPPSYLPVVENLRAKATAIARWAKETRTDINKVSLAQALEAISKYRFKTALGPQGVVAYRFADGWTVQDLREKKELEAEGKNLVHCVGGYCDEVVRGGSRIYSLRDPSGRAYVTLEWQPESVEQRGFWRGDPEDVGASERARNRWQDYISMDAEKFNGDGMTAQAYRTHGHFQQAYGQKNCPVSDDSCQAWLTALADDGEEPVYVEGLRRRLREFIVAKFDGDPESLMLIGIPGKEIDWTGRPLPYYIHALDLSGVDLTKVGHIKANTHFGKANEANFTGLDLAAANFIDASVVGAKFVGASLPDARFIRAMCVHADFTNADLRGADFTNADVSGAKFDGALVDQRTLLRGARGLDLDWQKRHLHLLVRPNQNRRTSRRRR